MHDVLVWILRIYIIIGVLKFLISVFVKRRTVRETLKLIDEKGIVGYE